MGWRAGRVVDVADVPVRLRATDRVRAEAMQRFFAAFLDSPRSPEVSMRVGARTPSVPRRRADQIVDGFDVWTSETALHVRLGESGRVGADDSAAVIGLRDGAGLDALPAAVHFALSHLLGLRDRFVVHGGAIVHSGRAFVVLGPTGAGKSTLIGATLGSDWRPLADDLVVLHGDGDSAMVAGIPRAVAVPADVGAPAGVRPAVADPRRRWIVPAEALATGWFPVAGVIVVGHGASPASAVDRLAGHDVLRLLMRSFTSGANPLLVRRFLSQAASAARRPAWRLAHGTDPSVRLDGARALLDDVLADARTRP